MKFEGDIGITEVNDQDKNVDELKKKTTLKTPIFTQWYYRETQITKTAQHNCRHFNIDTYKWLYQNGIFYYGKKCK